MSDFYESEFCLFLALVLLDAMDGVSEIEHYELDAEINYLCDMMDEYDLGYFECVLDLLRITH